jgi:pyruvate carboxylase
LDSRRKLFFFNFIFNFSIEIERGKVLHIVVLAISELMIETGEREVFFQVNGQLRSMKVKDKVAIKDQKVQPKVDKNNKHQIGKFYQNFILYSNLSSRCTNAWSSIRYQNQRR